MLSKGMRRTWDMASTQEIANLAFDVAFKLLVAPCTSVHFQEQNNRFIGVQFSSSPNTERIFYLVRELSEQNIINLRA